MTEKNDSDHKALCTAFYSIVDNDTPSEAIIVKSYTISCKPVIDMALNAMTGKANLETERTTPELEPNWANLPVNSMNLDSLHLPEEGMYEPKQIWERPAGHAVKGIDAFKIHCHVNSLDEPAAVVIGDSGAAHTLILHNFLHSLTAMKPKLRSGHRLKLIQLTGSAGCPKYIKLDLYFQSQLGLV